MILAKTKEDRVVWGIKLLTLSFGVFAFYLTNEGVDSLTTKILLAVYGGSLIYVFLAMRKFGYIGSYPLFSIVTLVIPGASLASGALFFVGDGGWMFIQVVFIVIYYGLINLCFGEWWRKKD